MRVQEPLAPVAEGNVQFLPQILLVDHSSALELDLRDLEGQEPFDSRQEEEAERERTRRGALIEPYARTIDEILQRFPDGHRKSIGSIRESVRGYIENYVVEFGQLPTGPHEIPTVGHVVLVCPE